jgi:hypothetical protein
MEKLAATVSSDDALPGGTGGWCGWDRAAAIEEGG